MIVVDTNVISEIIRLKPSVAVRNWFIAQPQETLWTTAISEAELLVGVALVPNGRRKRELGDAVQSVLVRVFPDRILPFDSGAANALPLIVAERRNQRLPADGADSQIAAIARAHGATVATRNIRDFAHCGIKVVDPWNSETQ